MKHLLLFLTLFLVACSSTKAPNYYLLTPDGQTTLNQQRQLSIGVGPIKFPRYLDRPQIVTRASENELTLSEMHRWAEPLRDNFSRVLAKNLSNEYGSNRIFIYPWKSADKVTYQVEVDILRFDTDKAGNNILQARWRLTNAKTGKLIRSDLTTLTTPVHGKGYSAIVAAMSENVAGLGKQIARR